MAERLRPRRGADPAARSEIDRVVAEVAARDAEAVAVSFLFSYLDSRHETRWARRWPAAARRPGHVVQRGGARVPRVPAHGDHRHQRRASSGRRGLPRARRGGGCESASTRRSWSCSPTAAACPRSAPRRGAPAGPLRTGRWRDRAGGHRGPARPRQRDQPRHGRHVDRRLPGPRRRRRSPPRSGRGPRAARAHRRHPHDRGGRRQHRLGGPDRAAAGRAAVRQRGAGTGRYGGAGPTHAHRRARGPRHARGRARWRAGLTVGRGREAVAGSAGARHDAGEAAEAIMAIGRSRT